MPVWWVGGLLVGTMCLHAALILFGAAVIDGAFDTALCALALSSLSAAPLVAVEASSKPSSLEVGAMLGAWVGAMFLPLDWGTWWIEWPLPLIYGSCLGHIFGVAIQMDRRTLKHRTRYAARAGPRLIS